MSDRDPWAPLCERGCLAMTVYTRARAVAEGMIFRDGAELVGAVHPDDGAAFDLGFPTAEHAATFVREMAPHGLRVLAAPHEDAADLLAQVTREPVSKLH